MQKIRAWAAFAAGKPLAPMTIERREPGPRDVVLEIGGIAETEEMLDHCAKDGIASDIEIIPIQRIFSTTAAPDSESMALKMEAIPPRARSSVSSERLAARSRVSARQAKLRAGAVAGLAGEADPDRNELLALRAVRGGGYGTNSGRGSMRISVNSPDDAPETESFTAPASVRPLTRPAKARLCS